MPKPSKPSRQNKKSTAEESGPKRRDPKSGSSARVKRSKPSPSVQKGGLTARAARPPCEKCGQIHKRCTAHNKAGGPCGQQARRGSATCRNHGGNAPQVRKAANERLAAMVIVALAQLERVLTKPDTNDSDRIKAALAILNRTGYAERHSIDLGLREPTPWDGLTNSAFTILRGVQNVIEESPTPQLNDAQREALTVGGGDADDEEALAAFLAHRKRMKAREAETRLANDGHDVVTGHVVDGPQPDSDLFGYPKSRGQKLAESGRPTEHDPDGHRSDEKWFEDYERRVREAVEDRG